MILKFLCLVLGLAMIGASFYQSWEEGLWQKQQLVHSFCAYLEDSYGQHYPITSDLTVIGSSHRLADIVPSIPGARSRQQYRSLSGIPKVCCQIVCENNHFYLENAHQKTLLYHGSEIHLNVNYSLYFYEGDLMYVTPNS